MVANNSLPKVPLASGSVLISFQTEDDLLTFASIGCVKCKTFRYVFQLTTPPASLFFRLPILHATIVHRIVRQIPCFRASLYPIYFSESFRSLCPLRYAISAVLYLHFNKMTYLFPVRLIA